jgi:hypothetical protein
VRQQALAAAAAAAAVFFSWQHVKHRIPVQAQPLQESLHQLGVVLGQYADGVAGGVPHAAARHIQLQVEDLAVPQKHGQTAGKLRRLAASHSNIGKYEVCLSRVRHPNTRCGFAGGWPGQEASMRHTAGQAATFL